MGVRAEARCALLFAGWAGRGSLPAKLTDPAGAPILAAYWMIAPRYGSDTAPLSEHTICSEGISVMQNPLISGIVIFLILLAGAFAGWMMRQRLPAHHLTDDTKSLVSVSMAVVARFRRWCLDC